VDATSKVSDTRNVFIAALNATWFWFEVLGLNPGEHEELVGYIISR
jgi:hypothetical protein